MKPLELCEHQLIRLIGTDPERCILGLLPVDPLLQEKVLTIVEACVAGDYLEWIRYSKSYPAACAYALVVALGKESTDDILSHWKAIEIGLKVAIPNSARADISRAFEEASQRIGLVPIPSDEETQGDRFLRPILFQAGILPRWSSHLASAIRRHLEHNPTPDLENEDQLARLAGDLAALVPDAVRRLPRTLRSPMGPLVCRLVVAAHTAKDFGLLPPHLQEPVRSSFQQVRVETSRGPYLRLDEGGQRLVLILPAQSARLASAASYWDLNGRHFRARREQELSVMELGEAETEIEIRLCRLNDGFRDQTYRVDLGPGAGDGFLVFRFPDCRQLAVSEQGPISLAPGSYGIVADSRVQGGDEDLFKPFGDSGSSRFARIEIRPGAKPVDIKGIRGNRQIIARIIPEFMLQRSGGDRVGSAAGESIYFGETLDLHAYVPQPITALVSGGWSIEFRIRCLTDKLIVKTVTDSSGGMESGCFRSFDLTRPLLKPFLEILSPGIHEIEIEAEGASRAFSKRFWYWKGLAYVSQVEGYVCSLPPANLELSMCSGVEMVPRGLRVPSGFIGGEMRLHVRGYQRTPPEIPRPGLWLVLHDRVTQTSSPLKMAEYLEVTPSGYQQVVVTSGDHLPWTISCGSAVLGRLEPDQPRLHLEMGGLAAQFGSTGIVIASREGYSSVELFRYATASVARDLRLSEEAPFPESVLSFVVGGSEISELGIEAIPITGEPSTLPTMQSLRLTSGTVPVSFWPEGVASWEVQPECGSWRVRLRMQAPALPAGAHWLVLHCRRSDKSPWRPLRVADRYGLSEGRIIVDGPSTVSDERPWTRLVESVRGAHLNRSQPTLHWLELGPVDTEDCLSRLQRALLVKYPTEVWNRCSWLGDGLVHLCQDIFPTTDPESQAGFAKVAVEGVLARCGRRLNLRSYLVFGCQSRVLSIPGKLFPTSAFDQSLAGRTWAELGLLGRQNRLADYASSHAPVATELWGFFSNGYQVAGAPSRYEFEDFQFERFFKAMADLDPNRMEDNGSKLLLSPDHLHACVVALNRRFAPFDHFINVDGGGAAASGKEGIARLTQDIRGATQNLFRVLPDLKDLMGCPKHVDFSIPLPSAEDPLIQSVSDSLLAVAGFGRLCAAGRIDRNHLKERMRQLLGGEKNLSGRALRIERLCLLLSLAPELFAFHMLLWDIVLKPARRP